MYFKNTLYACYLQKPFSKYFKSLVCFLHLAVVFGAPAKVLPEWGLWDGLCEQRLGLPCAQPALHRSHPRAQLSPSATLGAPLESAWIRGTHMERRKTGNQGQSRSCTAEELWHTDEPIWNRCSPKGTMAHGRPMLEQMEQMRRMEQWKSGKKRGTEKNCCGLTLHPLAITQGAEYSPQ